MRTLNWMVSATLLLSLSAVAQQPADSQPTSQPATTMSAPAATPDQTTQPATTPQVPSPAPVANAQPAPPQAGPQPGPDPAWARVGQIQAQRRALVAGGVVSFMFYATALDHGSVTVATAADEHGHYTARWSGS